MEASRTQIARTPSPDWPQIRDIQEELLLAYRQGLNIPQDNIGVIRKGKWSKEEREALLGWLSDGGNYARVKTKGKRVWMDLAQDKGLFCGTRSWSAIKGQWEDWKKRYEAAKRRVESTGEGQKEKEQWPSMESRKCSNYSIPYNLTNNYLAEWLNNQCPNYRWIAEILQKDKSFTAPLCLSSEDHRQRVSSMALMADRNRRRLRAFRSGTARVIAFILLQAVRGSFERKAVQK
jgi:hypothetical protein